MFDVFRLHDDVSRALSLFMAFHILSSFLAFSSTPAIGGNLLLISGGTLRLPKIHEGFHFNLLDGEVDDVHV